MNPAAGSSSRRAPTGRIAPLRPLWSSTGTRRRRDDEEEGVRLQGAADTQRPLPQRGRKLHGAVDRGGGGDPGEGVGHGPRRPGGARLAAGTYGGGLPTEALRPAQAPGSGRGGEAPEGRQVDQGVHQSGRHGLLSTFALLDNLCYDKYKQRG